MAGLAKLVNGGESFAGKTVTLGDNINLDGKPWTPIGTSSAAFEGTFNGDGHTVSGVNVEVANGEQYTGFFGYVGDADITDLTLADIHIKSDNRAAGLIGHITAPDAKNVTISDVTVSGEVEAIEYAAGILGDIRTASKDYVEGTTVTISGCTNNANLTATAKDYEGAKVVGIVGHVEGLNPTITNCTNNGNISVTTKGDAVVAGIAGYIMDSTATEISGCTNNGSITVNSDYTKKCNIGGIISTAHAGTFTISDVENHGAITVNVKRSYGEEEKGSYAAKAAVAGIVGSTSQNVTVTNAENTANVTVTDARDNSTVAVGGVFGYNDGATQTVINGTNTGELSGTGGQSRYVGQMVGYLAKASTLVLTGCSGVGDAALLGGEIGGANVTIN